MKLPRFTFPWMRLLLLSNLFLNLLALRLLPPSPFSPAKEKKP